MLDSILYYLQIIGAFWVLKIYYESKREEKDIDLSTFGMVGSVSHPDLPNEKTIAVIRIDGQLKCVTATINLKKQVFTIGLNEFRLGLVGELKETLSISSTTD